MAIVTDPDNLDRYQVIYGTTDKLLSLYPCGALAHASADRTDGVTVNGTKTFTSAGATFTTWSIAPGDILCIYTGEDAGHYVIDTVDSQTQLTLLAAANFSPGDTGQVYQIRDPTGGTIDDGVTLQCLYSFTKEEWRVDSETFGSDDLIRHPFPLELVTREQGEIGGGTKLGNWEFADLAGDDYTRKKIRTGGWSSYNSSSVLQNTWTGMRSLGSLDSDAQAYFQQTSATTAPEDFEFTGPVNEAVETATPTPNNTYFKAFCRKKFRYYAQYNLLTEQGISALENILYSFPLSHSADPAIVDRDAEIEGNTPYTNFAQLESGTNGVTTVSTLTFSSVGATFSTNGVIPGDILYIAGTGSDAGYYKIAVVDSETQLTLTADADDGITTFAGDTGLTYQVNSRFVLHDSTTPATDGALADVDGDTGTLTSTTGGFSGVVAADDIVIIVEAASDHRGAYKVVSVSSDTVLVLNTEDRIFTSVSNQDFYVVEPGMYLEYKSETVDQGSPGNLTFADADPDTIQRASGTWTVAAGDMITITSSTNNNGSYTVASGNGTNTITLVASDSLTAEGPVAAVAAVTRHFTRTIQSVAYPFEWRVFGNDGELGDIYQWHQKLLREAVDIDVGPAVNRGDITDPVMTFIDPNAVTTSMYIDDLNAADTNSVTYYDATGTARLEAFVSAGNITFNDNLQGDANAIYHMFFLNDDAGDNNGYDYGTENAITVKDASNTDIKGNVSGSPSISFTYDFDGNVQRGAASAGQNAPVVVVAIGLGTAQFYRFDGTITRTKGLTFALSSALERNYST